MIRKTPCLLLKLLNFQVIEVVVVEALRKYLYRISSEFAAVSGYQVGEPTIAPAVAFAYLPCHYISTIQSRDPASFLATAFLLILRPEYSIYALAIRIICPYLSNSYICPLLCRTFAPFPRPSL